MLQKCLESRIGTQRIDWIDLQFRRWKHVAEFAGDDVPEGPDRPAVVAIEDLYLASTMRSYV